MINYSTSSLLKAVLTLFLLFLVFAGLYFSRSFLIPIALAGILSMLFLPLGRWFESKGINRAVASVFCLLVLIGFVAVLVFLITWRISNLEADFNQIQQQGKQYLDQLQDYINNKFGVSEQQQKQLIQKQGSSGAGSATTYIAGFAGSLLGSVTTTVLIFIYIFLFINSRNHLKKFILKLVASDKKANAQTIIEESTSVAQKYVSGLAKMIVCLWVMYGVGFSIIGVQNAVFFAVICGTLEIIPFVGNLTGTTLTVLMALAQGGGASMVLSVLIVYGLVQFIQSYLLEPLVVGKGVNISPLSTILVLVLGEEVWGIGGMVLSIPLLGMLKIVFDHIESLKPYGFLIGGEDDDDTSFIDKIKGWFKRS